MSLPIQTRVGGGDFEIELVPNASNLVTTIWVRNTQPGPVYVWLRHDGSGYELGTETNPREFVLAAPISINVPNNRRFPDDQTLRGYAKGPG